MEEQKFDKNVYGNKAKSKSSVAIHQSEQEK